MIGYSVGYGIVLHPQLGNWAIACEVGDGGKYAIMTPNKAKAFAFGCIKKSKKSPEYHALSKDQRDNMIEMWADIAELAKEAERANREKRMPNAGQANTAAVGRA